MDGIKLIGETRDCRILSDGKGRDRGEPLLKPEVKRRRGSGRNGTESSFMIHKEFMRNNSFAVASNSCAKILALFEFFGLVHSYVRSIVSNGR